MASGDATSIAVKNQAYRVTFPILDADGDLVTGATALDSEVSKDGGTFADVTAEATEIATNSGMYFLDLTATEMNADTVAIIVKTTSSGAKTTPIVLYPNDDGDIDVSLSAQGKLDVNVEADTALTDYDPPTKAEMDTGHGLLSTEAKQDIIDTAVDAIKAVTDLLPNAGALIDLALILADTGTTLPAEHAALSAEHAALNDPTAAVIADAVWDEARADHVGAASFGRMQQALLSETAAAGGASSVTLSVSAAPFIGNIVQIVGGTGAGQSRVIVSNAGSIAVIIPDWDTEPDATSEIVILPFGSTSVVAQTAEVIEFILNLLMRRSTSVTEIGVGGTPDKRTLYGVIAALMHKHTRTATVITLYESDDTTVLAEIPIVETASLRPISSIDPPG